MDNSNSYDVTVIGGGLAGLALAIQLSKKNYRVALFEKEQYPFHKVCGEYISMESWNFIESLGLSLSSMNLPLIKKLMVTAPDGTVLNAALPLGGFGISRYVLDHELKKIADTCKVTVYEKCKVEEVHFNNDFFYLQTSKGNFTSKVCAGSFGKRSNLDLKWKRNFVLSRKSKLNNYIGVKYHLKTDFPVDSIALHNFEHGYCGISSIEEGKYCVCYLTNAYNLSRNNNSIQQMEQNILFQNKHLQQLFSNCEKLLNVPVTISQISFNTKEQVYDHILLLGDAAGMITPLCGNGMSMALHSSKIAALHIHEFLQDNISRQLLEDHYTTHWKKIFAHRVKVGMVIQTFFGRKWLTNLFIRCMKRMPGITRKIIAQTHGTPF
ncbi:MAG: FAD-dependent monooxygenase [Chitinophagaceae bacterium]|nr:FAD-dependent monooxygenase [Chitinophagaceae bacterium]